MIYRKDKRIGYPCQNLIVDLIEILVYQIRMKSQERLVIENLMRDVDNDKYHQNPF